MKILSYVKTYQGKIRKPILRTKILHLRGFFSFREPLFSFLEPRFWVRYPFGTCLLPIVVHDCPPGPFSDPQRPTHTKPVLPPIRQ